MAWTTPRTYTDLEIVTAAILNTDHRDNLNALSAHQHSGAPGDGARLIPPDFVTDTRKGITFGIPASNTIADTTIIINTTNATLNTAPAYDSTNKWVYLTPSVTASGGAVQVDAQHCYCTTQLLPEFIMAVQHVSTATNTIRMGLADGVLTADPTNGIYFRNINGGNWEAVVRKAGTETATSTGVAASTTTPKSYRIKVDSPTQVTFYIAGASVRVETGANIPDVSTVLRGRFGFTTSAIGTFTCRIADWFGVSHEVISS